MVAIYAEKNTGTSAHLVDLQQTYRHYRDTMILNDSRDPRWERLDKETETPTNKLLKTLFVAISRHPPNMKDTTRLTPILALASQIFGKEELDAITITQEDISNFVMEENDVVTCNNGSIEEFTESHGFLFPHVPECSTTMYFLEEIKWTWKET